MKLYLDAADISFYEGVIEAFPHPYNIAFKTNWRGNTACSRERWEATSPEYKSRVRDILQWFIDVPKHICTMISAEKYSIPSELITSDLAIAMTKKYGPALQFIPHEKLTPDCVEHALKKDGEALMYLSVEDQTDALRKMAVRSSGVALRFIPEEARSEEICKLAVQQNGLALGWVPMPLRTRDICVLALKQNGYALRQVPADVLTYDLCELAVFSNGWAMESVPVHMRTDVLWKIAKIHAARYSIVVYDPELEYDDTIYEDVCPEHRVLYQKSTDHFPSLLRMWKNALGRYQGETYCVRDAAHGLEPSGNLMVGGVFDPDDDEIIKEHHLESKSSLYAPKVFGPKEHKDYYAEILVKPEALKTINGYLNAVNEEDYQAEDETISYQAQFENGFKMEVKCCGSQDGCSWTEAVLYDLTGVPVCHSEPSDGDFEGEWELTYQKQTYHAMVKEAKDHV